MGRKVTVSVCGLNQWALDFEGNYHRIVESVRESKKLGATYRLGPELEICGYGCEDHFFESDTVLHCFEVLAKLLERRETKAMICDVGMPVLYKNLLYNCRVMFLYKKILFIRPKMILAGSGNYSEYRWFTPWVHEKHLEDFDLPKIIQDITGQKTVPIGDGLLSTLDACIGSEICAELWPPRSIHIDQSLDGCEIFTNASGSEYAMGKYRARMDLVKEATARCGGVYLFTNIMGCDGGWAYYDNACMIAVNGEIVAQGPQFSLNDVEVVTATVDLDDVHCYRAGLFGLRNQSDPCKPFPRIDASFDLSNTDPYVEATLPLSEPLLKPCYHSPEEEIALGSACWLWDYLRRSSMSGYFLVLSGNVDSLSVACIVYSMCVQVCSAIGAGNEQVLKDLRRIVDKSDFLPNNPREVCKEILTTCYMEDRSCEEW